MVSLYTFPQEAMLAALEMAWVNELLIQYVLRKRDNWHIFSSASFQYFKFQAIQSPNKLLMLDDPKKATLK